ncbi:AraC family transcriptional regulator [Chitinophaga japonensis]|uniref:AraC-like DNA-binding protein n=1 Tax=Chitinophaga japonensis TaxID=104662 RepID=A0A562SIM1_CHIJA|nr:helix-turn-helix domain-containing protein [Chitinophaga japonensis]TWI80963.1 AraC-like DNA-binding protein [Chitinophaga japonensis]
MQVTYLPPAIRVAEYVREILVIEDCRVTNPFVLPLFANGTPTLLFQTAKGQIGHATNNLTLFGQTVFPDTLTIREDFTLIAYFFQPYALNSLFGVSAQELTDNPIDLNLLPAQVRAGLQEQLLNATGSSEMIALLDNYIFSLTTRIKTDMRIIKYAVEKIASAPSKKNLAVVQQELYMTGRTFQRLFRKNIGIIPTQFRRISQFNAAFRQLNQLQFKNLTDLSFSNGYADQSHFIRAFREFTSLTPGEYLAYRQPAEN